MTLRFDLLVLGGGPAGVTAALHGRELGASVAIVERDRLGGTCTDDGCAPTRVLARAARMVRDGQQFTTFGLVGAPPRVDLPQLLEHAQRTVYRLHEKKQLAGHLRSIGAEVFEEAGAARFVGARVVELADGRQIAAERVVICVGGHARRLTFPGADLALTHSDVWSLRTLPPSTWMPSSWRSAGRETWTASAWRWRGWRSTADTWSSTKRSRPAPRTSTRRATSPAA